MYRVLQSQSHGSSLAVHCIVAAVFLSYSAFALDPSRQLTQYIQSSWSSDSGLPQNSAHAITQTKDGYLRLGTEEGLARFDGVRFQTFKRKTNNGLASDSIDSLFAASDDTPWIGNDSGLSYFRFVCDPTSSGKSSLPIKSDALSRESITANCEDRDEAIWVGSNYGLRRGLHVAAKSPVTGNDLPVHAVSALAAPGGNSFWAGIHGLGSVGHWNSRALPPSPNILWTQTNSRYSFWRTNPPPGRDAFSVRAVKYDGARNDAEALFGFVLLRPFARSPLGFLLCATVLILLAWVLTAVRTRRLSLSRRKLEHIAAERTAQLEAENSALEKARRELHIQATHDVLTGLYNRRAMIEHIDREMSRAARDGTTLGIFIADLDHFKLINDRLGHICGDDIIRESGLRFQQAIRGYDIVGRYGGEEFLILCPDFDIQNHPQRIENLLDAIRSKPFIIESSEEQVTCSIGVGTFRPAIDKFDARAALKRADAALYAAKHAGRNCARCESRNAVEEGIKADA